MYIYNDMPDELSWPLHKKIAHKIAGWYKRFVVQVKLKFLA